MVETLLLAILIVLIFQLGMLVWISKDIHESMVRLEIIQKDIMKINVKADVAMGLEADSPARDA